MEQSHIDSAGNGNWHAPLAPRFSRVCWNDEYFLFNPGTGQTHVLNQMSIDILDMLSSARLTTAAIQARMADHWEVEAERLELFKQQIAEHLEQLCYLGLISDGRFDDRLLS